MVITEVNENETASLGVYIYTCISVSVSLSLSVSVSICFFICQWKCVTFGHSHLNRAKDTYHRHS